MGALRDRASACSLAVATAVLLTLLAAVGGQANAQPEPFPSGVSDVLDRQTTPSPGAASQGPVGGQYLDGRVDVCVQVPDVPGGTYHLAWVGYLSQLVGRTTPTVLPTGSTGASPAILLSATPRSVLPGQTVTLTGTLRRPQKINRDAYISLCWGGCPGGLKYYVPADWLSASTFSARITAPDAPWAQTAPDQVVSPVAGDYEVGVQCVELIKACGLGPAEGEAVVHLNSAAAFTCQSVPGCAHLGTSPETASPGQVVRLSGYAPLTSTSAEGEHLMGGYVEGERGGRPGPAVRFSARNVPVGALTVEVRAGDAPVRVEPAPTWASLGRLRPIGQVPGTELPISSNPADPSTVAWCASGYVDLQGPGGATKVPTGGATALLLADRALPDAGKEQFQDCSTVAVEDGAVFVGYAYSPEMMAPAVDNVALYSTDSGRSWSFVPVPPGSQSSGFGGFRYGPGGSVDAIFAGSAPSPGAVAVPAVEQYSSATGSWSQAPFACPASGPCVTWSTAMEPDCGMDASIAQTIESTDGGQHWAFPPRDLGYVNTCWSASVVAVSPSEALVVGVDGAVNASGVYPLVMTTDNARGWELVSLPPLPGQVPGAQQSLFVLPDGAIVDISSQPWDLLGPGATAWCPVAAVPVEPAGTFAHPASYTVIGPALWWLTSGLASGSPALAYHVADSSLTCRR